MAKDEKDLGLWRKVYANLITGDRINRCSMAAQGFFTRLVCAADDFGNVRSSPRDLYKVTSGDCAEITEEKIAEWCAELAREKLILPYIGSDERSYFHLSEWRLRQAPPNGKPVPEWPLDPFEDGEPPITSKSKPNPYLKHLETRGESKGLDSSGFPWIPQSKSKSKKESESREDLGAEAQTNNHACMHGEEGSKKTEEPCSKVLRALEEAGITEPNRTRLARQTGITAEIVRDARAAAIADKKTRNVEARTVLKIGDLLAKAERNVATAQRIADVEARFRGFEKTVQRRLLGRFYPHDRDGVFTSAQLRSALKSEQFVSWVMSEAVPERAGAA